ncbi:MAG TPA: cytochrome P450 [Roseiflexaceae bacterium]|nr:cytochrome P450 [Roseiflexaceae bacterium]
MTAIVRSTPRSTPALNVPGPRPLPLIGATGNATLLVSDSIGRARKLFEAYGPIVAVTQGGGTRIYSSLPSCPGTVLVYGPELVREATTQHNVYHKQPLSGELYPTRAISPRTAPLQHFLTGLFGVNGDEHRQHRRLLMPAFHRQRISTYRDDMVAITQSSIANWQPGERRDMAEEMMLLTMRIATKTLFGEDVGERGRTVCHMLRESLRLLASPMTHLLPRDKPGLPYRRLLDLAAHYEMAMREIIRQKRADGGTGNDMLSLLLEARDETSGEALTEDELLGHVGVIFAAGHETSANALTWTLFLLAQHPQIASDLLDELDGVLHGDAPSLEQLARLPLLDYVIKESMRVLPPVPWNGRVTSQATELGGYMLPAGTEVLASIYQTHQMPEIYPEPRRFDPRRWERIDPTIFEYNPFSAGPRMCIGATFAMIEIKIVLAMLLQRYRLQCLPRLVVDRAGVIVLSPKRGMPMTINRQDRNFAAGASDVRGNVREMVELNN